MPRQERLASSFPRRRAWDSSLSDLSVYRATPPDIERRKAKTRSNNAYQARAELDKRQQRMMVGDFSQVLEALEPIKLSDRNRPLDYESPRTAERPKHSDANVHIENVSSPHRPPANPDPHSGALEQVHAQLDDLGQPFPSGVDPCTPEGAAPLPPPNLARRSCDAVREPVVDLDLQSCKNMSS